MLVNILMGVAAVILLLLIVALFVKKQYAIEREILINRPKAEVFHYLKHLKNQDNYSKWVQTDPNMRKEYRGVDGTVGFVYAGTATIKPVKANRKLKPSGKVKK